MTIDQCHKGNLKIDSACLSMADILLTVLNMAKFSKKHRLTSKIPFM